MSSEDRDSISQLVSRFQSGIDREESFREVFHRFHWPDLVEAEDSLLELHLHGPVKREHIQEVRLSKADYRHLCDLARRAEELSAPLPWEFDNVEPFRRLLDLLDQFDIPLVLAEE